MVNLSSGLPATQTPLHTPTSAPSGAEPPVGQTRAAANTGSSYEVSTQPAPAFQNPSASTDRSSPIAVRAGLVLAPTHELGKHYEFSGRVSGVDQRTLSLQTIGAFNPAIHSVTVALPDGTVKNFREITTDADVPWFYVPTKVSGTLTAVQDAGNWSLKLSNTQVLGMDDSSLSPTP